MKTDIQEKMKAAMKAKDKLRVDTLRAVLSAIQYEEMQKNVDSLDEKSTLAVIRSEIKKSKEEIEFNEKANRAAEIETLKTQLAILEEFLPQQLSESQLEEIVNTIRSTNPEATLGLVMKELNSSHPGQFDGKLASDVARRLLS